ncbi:MAG: dehydrogenase [Draconibacterium sp.]|nr:MAG: dehydrogenase [Draconibacterium sp.]PIF06455.1 MAG: dehydrogenase [Draconibacterium sp.]
MAITNPENFNTSWRKVASTIYNKPSDSKIYGSVELDITELEKYISKKRKSGLKITLTHIITLIIGRALRNDVPELNTYVQRGKIVPHKGVVAMVSILLPDNTMGSAKVKNTDQLTLAELADILKQKINNARTGNENRTMQKKNLLANSPWPLRKWFFYVYKKLTVQWGISLPFTGLKPDSFGSYVVSNIGTLGLDQGYGALFPTANIGIVLILGSHTKKPVVIDDKVEIRKILNLSATLDHRVVDASHGGKLFRYIKYMIKNPHLLENPPD